MCIINSIPIHTGDMKRLRGFCGWQITFENSDTSASSSLATSLRNTGGSTIYVPGFGNAAVTTVKEFTVPAADPKLSLCAQGSLRTVSQ